MKDRLFYILASIIGVFLLFSFAFAGEREELQLKQALMREIMIRAQLEMQAAQAQFKEISQQIQALDKEPKKKTEEKGREGGTTP